MSLNDSASTLEGSGDGDSSRESGIAEEDHGEREIKRVDDKSNGDLKSEEWECITNRNFEALRDSESKSCNSATDNICTAEPDGNEADGRRTVKKLHGFDLNASQSRRRKETLQWQKQRRDEMLDKIRQLEDSAYSDSETEDELDFAQTVQQVSLQSQDNLGEIREEVNLEEEMDVADAEKCRGSQGKKKSHKKRPRTNRRYRQAPCRPMLSEWLLDRPDDFEDKWLGVVCPVGKRCLVLASRGKTKIYSRSDEYLGSYKSALPGGCKYHYRDSTTNRNRGVTILDCIWSQQSQTFYVLDIICWNSHSCVNCDTDYRQFFLHSKFSENLELLESSALNPFPFKPLPFFAASEMSSVLASPIMFPESVDGILLFHKEAFYIYGTNPLCLWILLTQVESLLHIPVSPDLLSLQVQPKNLNSRNIQIQKKLAENEMNIMDTNHS